MSWIDQEKFTEFQYKKDRVETKWLGDMAHGLERDILALIDELSFGYKDLFFPVASDGKGAHIVDEIANNRFGFSFLDVNKSRFGQPDRLLLRLLADTLNPKAKSICYLAPGQRVVYVRPALKGWVGRYCRLSLLLLLHLEVVGGGAARSTEITGATFRNPIGGRLRNLAITGDHMAIFRRYHKMSVRTAVDAAIPETLSASGVWAMIQHLALFRPFAELAIQEIHADHPQIGQISHMWHTAVFPNDTKLFTVKHLSGVLGEYTEKYLNGARWGVNIFRNVSAGCKRKVLRINTAILEDSRTIATQDTIDNAASLGHSVDAAIQNYAPSRDHRPGAREDLQDTYYRNTKRWHIFLGIVPGVSFRDLYMIFKLR